MFRESTIVVYGVEDSVIVLNLCNVLAFIENCSTHCCLIFHLGYYKNKNRLEYLGTYHKKEPSDCA